MDKDNDGETGVKDSWLDAWCFVFVPAFLCYDRPYRRPLVTGLPTYLSCAVISPLPLAPDLPIMFRRARDSRHSLEAATTSVV